VGGLRREEALGTAGFTLSLPVPRWRIVAARAVAGAGAGIALAAIPMLIVTLLSPLAGYAFPLGQALLFAATTAGVGMIFYGFGFLLSHLFRGEYTAPAIAMGIVGLFWVITRTRQFHPYDIFRVMSGAPFMDERTLYVTAMPWLAISISLAVFAVLVGGSAVLVRRRDF
jgi:ABC-2 type transport system permease protein